MSEQQVAGSAPGAEVEGAVAPVVEAPKPQTQKSLVERAKEMIEQVEKEKAAEAPVAEDASSSQPSDEPAEEAETEEVAEEAEDSEDEELVKPDDPESFKKRVEKLGARIEEAHKERDEIATKYEAVVQELSGLRNVERVAQDFQTVAEIDPTLKELVSKHWFFKGRMPTVEDFDGDQAAYSRMVEIIQERRAEAKLQSERAEKEHHVSAEERMKAYDAESENLKAHPVYGQFINDSDLARTFEFIAKRVKAGDDQYDSLEKAFDVLFREKIAAAWKKRGAEEAVKRMDASRKTNRVIPKGAPAARPDIDPKKWRSMSTVEKARHLTAQMGGSN